MKKNLIPASTPAFLAASLAFCLASCAPIVDTHGTIIQQSQVEQIKPQVTTQDQVRQLLGSPATEGTLNNNRWVYMTSTVEDKPLDPGILKKRQVVIIDFDPSGTVVDVTQKTEADSKTVNPVEKVTPTHGQSLGIIDQMFKNIGVSKD